jgi:hypothetical protein
MAMGEWRKGLRGLAPAAALYGLAAFGFSLLIGPAAIAANPGALMSLMAAMLGPTALFYALAMRGAFGHGYGFRGETLRDGVAVFSGVGVVGFFLFLALIAANVAANAILFAPFMEELQGAENDPAAMQAMAERVMTENPLGVILAFFVFALVTLLLTSRLYLAGPESVAAHRGRSFETWAWTKGNMFRIIGARLLLLVPAYVLASLVGIVAAGPFGALFSLGSAEPSALGVAVGLGVLSGVQAVVHHGLEAHLAVVLHKGLRPPAAN